MKYIKKVEYRDDLIITYDKCTIGNKTYNVTITENKPSEQALRNFLKKYLEIVK